MRPALERQLFHHAVNDAENLHLLLRSLRASGTSGSLVENVSTCLHRLSAPAASHRLDALRACVRLAIRRWSGPVAFPSDADSVERTEFLFCTIGARFVGFFRPLLERLGSERGALLCVGGAEIADQATALRLPVRQLTGRGLRLRSLARPPLPLFPLYADAAGLLTQALATLRRLRPTAVVFGEGASAQEWLVAVAARRLGVPTIRVQHGRAGILGPGYRDMPFDKVLTWGEGFEQRLRARSPHCRYRITGSPIFAEARAMPVTVAEGDHRLCVITQPISRNIRPEDYAALVSVTQSVVQRLPGLQVLVRLHPADRADDFRLLAARWPARIRVETASDRLLGVVLRDATLVLGLYSTVLSEAAALGVLPVVMRLGERHRVFPAPEDEGAAALAASPAEAEQVIAALLADEGARRAYSAAMDRFATRYFGPRDDRAVERIVEHIVDPLA